jgi:nucleoside-diphosphate-sugar epimerase
MSWRKNLANMKQLERNSGKSILVLGARSMLGGYLVPLLVASGHDVTCISRQACDLPPETAAAVSWRLHDIGKSMPIDVAAGSIVISLLPLWLLPPLLAQFREASHLIAFGSTSVLTKTESVDIGDRDLANKLGKAESDIVTGCEPIDLDWTILRPTMIYGGGRDQNISAIAAVMRKYRIFPLAGAARGLRQPVHGRDLAQAACAAVTNGAARNKAFNLPGGETLTYTEMVERIALKIRKKVWVFHVPEVFLRAVFYIAKRLGLTDHGAGMVARINQDLTFDATAANSDLEYNPRPFDPEV